MSEATGWPTAITIPTTTPTTTSPSSEPVFLFTSPESRQLCHYVPVSVSYLEGGCSVRYLLLLCKPCEAVLRIRIRKIVIPDSTLKAYL